ncbi:unnamed protein product [Phytophthora fragariaefolia]|uniref:Unnamed protein product n=1 Tax=Phytophthora fragariaefolia TaxID=1490495 RepID=A0A9W7CUS9_9STRA|nr:unnamed protein product [Phytophthora fragariaefolia]
MTEGDNVPPVEALAMVCRRLSDASKLFPIASEFGRSTAAYSRVFAATVQIMYENHRERLYFHDALIKERIDEYCDVTHASRSSYSSTFPDFRIDWHWSALNWHTSVLNRVRLPIVVHRYRTDLVLEREYSSAMIGFRI